MMQGLTVKEMEELRDDIKMHLDMDRATPTHIEYWEVKIFIGFPIYSLKRFYVELQVSMECQQLILDPDL